MLIPRPSLALAGMVLAVAIAATASSVAVVRAGEAPTAATASASTVVVKFREGSGLRIRAGALVSGAGATRATAAELARRLAAAGADLTSARRLIDRSEADLDAERRAIEAAGGTAVPDLNLFYVIKVPAGTTAEAFAARLAAVPGVESAEPSPVPHPPPVDLTPPTPLFNARQTYFRGPPVGVGALPLAKYPGGGGATVTVADLEYSWQLNHEDLELPATANLDRTATALDPFSDPDHGTAVLGEIYGRANTYGVKGLAAHATMRVVPANTVQFGYNPARAISVATAALKAGDVIVIEQQYPVCGLSAYGPLEWMDSVYAATRVATQKGIVVVAAAGNGGVNLDGAGCQGKFNRSIRDSGAIIVGAGVSTTRQRHGFSSYGSRVDVHGWGDSVTTTGYGDLFDAGARQLYTGTFSGTSSATPIVAGVVTQIQGALKGLGRAPARPTVLRAALVATGTPQVTPPAGKIGPLPATERALNRLLLTRGS
jgi:serine protease